MIFLINNFSDLLFLLIQKELMDINPYRMKKFSFWEYKIISEELYRFLKKNYMVWIYGAGKNARLLISMLEELGIAEIKGIIVTDKACNPANYNGYKIYGIDDIENIHKEAIVITPKIGGDDIKKELDKRNVVNSICIFQ